MITVENYNVYKIHDMLYPKEIEILKNGIGSITKFRDNIENYHYDYRDKPGNLFRILDEGRYKRGAYYIMTTKDDEYVLSTGWNEYDRDTASFIPSIGTYS
jgi:hypothetical protein